MAQATPEQTARAVLQALVHRVRVRAGQGALIELLKNRAEAEGVDWFDLSAGLKYAAGRAWLVYDERNGWVRLTDAGWLASQ